MELGDRNLNIHNYPHNIDQASIVLMVLVKYYDPSKKYVLDILNGYDDDPEKITKRTILFGMPFLGGAKCHKFNLSQYAII